jgi:D-glycero-D-manno-heptose 1,7-bisphosphate phosphatase
MISSVAPETAARNPAVFLDRDGVINEAIVGADGVARGPASAADLRVCPDAPEALGRLRAAGFLLVVVTNQPDLGRGLVSKVAVDEIHAVLREALPLDAVYCCPHGGSSPCACRKPAPGMVLDAASDLGIDLGASWLIGDRWVDVAAGAAAGVRTVLLQLPHSWDPTSAGAAPPDLVPDHVGRTLAECVGLVLRGGRPSRAVTG